jgi:hypothetical protein
MNIEIKRSAVTGEASAFRKALANRHQQPDAPNLIEAFYRSFCVATSRGKASHAKDSDCGGGRN